MAEIDRIGFLTELNIQDVIAYIAEDDAIEYDEAIDRFYRSATFSKLTDRETGLYRESPTSMSSIKKSAQTGN